MHFIRNAFFLFLGCCALSFCAENESPELRLLNAYVGTSEINLSGDPTTDIPVNELIVLSFSTNIDVSSVNDGLVLRDSNGNQIGTQAGFLSNNKTITLDPTANLERNSRYTIDITSELISKDEKKAQPKSVSFITERGSVTLAGVSIADQLASPTNQIIDVPLNLHIELSFTTPILPESATQAISISGLPTNQLLFTFSSNNTKLEISSSAPLKHLYRYRLNISSQLEGMNGESFGTYSKFFYTAVDPTPKLPLLPNDEDNDTDNTNDLLSVVQKQTFKYFWDFAHPASGMARERNTSGDLVTSGGSGFGIMALIVGMERNFITRTEGLQRMDKILDYLETADRFHGAWPHWLNGNTGDVIPFSPNDNGGDLVETAFLVEGLITFRQYLNPGVPAEQVLINRINTLWQAVEWDWYRQDNQNVLYWHWSPDKGWAMNLPIKGWNEALIIYVLAASAPANNTIPKAVYDAGWASNGGMRNGSTYEGVTLPLGSAYGGPLFFTHYSFLGLDPRNLSDQYANYWTQNVNHSLINYKYCVRNPKNFPAYGEDCWGLTASDNNLGYSAHSPTNDIGVITPTAALSSFPYTPTESMRALKFFYYTMGDRLWGDYGFYDAFNASENWYADSYLAIDQGPIIVMIENYRTGLLWELFMSAPEVQSGLDKLGFD